VNSEGCYWELMQDKLLSQTCHEYKNTKMSSLDYSCQQPEICYFKNSRAAPEGMSMLAAQTHPWHQATDSVLPKMPQPWQRSLTSHTAIYQVNYCHVDSVMDTKPSQHGVACTNAMLSSASLSHRGPRQPAQCKCATRIRTPVKKA